MCAFLPDVTLARSLKDWRRNVVGWKVVRSEGNKLSKGYFNQGQLSYERY